MSVLDAIAADKAQIKTVSEQSFPDAAILMWAKDGQFDVQMSLPKGGELDEKNPAHSMLKWLSENWDGILEIHNNGVKLEAFKRINGDADDAEPKIQTSTGLKLINADGTGLVQH